MKCSDADRLPLTKLDVDDGQAPIPKRWTRYLGWSFVAMCALYYLNTWAIVGHVHRPELSRATSWALDAFAHSKGRIMGEKAEQLYLSTPDPESALATSRKYATHPHLAGSTEDFSDAKDILAVFQENFGIHPPSEAPIFAAGSAASRGATLGVNRLTKPAAWIDIYYPVLNTPLDRSLSILDDDGTATWTADLVEDGDPADPEAAKYRDYVPTFHGLSHDGDVEGQLIYANYGRKEDFDEILAAGGNFTGKIVLVRYGRNFRGLKVSGAEELGALGVLIYSDPRDDGSVTISNGYAPYPEGPARNPTSVQRGSVQYLSIYPGDPTTPGAPAYPNATRTEGKNIPYIPSLPISWANAQRLLEEIAQGGLGESQILDGRTSARKVRLVNHVDTKVTPIWNTMAAIPGHIKNETVVIGCHRDAWVMGAADPTSGTVSLHEVIRGFGALLKSGWRPLRNVVFASWDAEEYGLIGSTEWTEDFPEWISQHVVAYINVDVSVAGSRWHSGASPSLAHLIRQAALEVPHPTAVGKSLWDAREDAGPFLGPADSEFLASYELEGTHASDVGIYPLGSGSDYTPFLQRLGVASMDQGFSGTPTDAPYHYHSVYDSQRWQELYADPGFYRHVAVAKHLGLVALRVADAIILPLNTTQYALELDYYLDKVESIASELFVSADFSALRRSIAHLQTASKDLDAEKAKAEAKFRKLLKKLLHRRESCKARKSSLPGWLRKLLKILHVHRPRGFPIRKFIKAAKRVQAVNAKLIAFERGFISEEGLKDREWYRHLAVAPGKWLGYGATTLPSITEALTIDKNVTLAELEAVRVTKLVENLSEVLAV